MKGQQRQTKEGDDRLVGTWSVYDATAAFRERDFTGICETLSAFDRGERELGDLFSSDAAGAPTIVVRIDVDGGMSMTIRRSMRPDMPATMRIEARMRWNLSRDRLQTQADPASLKVVVEVEGGPEVSAERFADAKRKAGEIETSTLRAMKGDALWNDPNSVTILHSGPRTFLTKASVGNLMLHVRKDTLE